MGFIENCNTERTEKIKKLNPQPNQFVALISCFDGVYFQIDKVFDNACVIYRSIHDKSDEVKTEYTFFHNIHNVVDKLPKNAYSVMCKEGSFSTRRGNLNKIPKQYYE